MNLTRHQKIFFWSALFLIYLLAWIAQSQLLIKGDVSWQMKLAKIVLAGGTYGKDFFEINPPLSIYLYMPPLALTKYFSLMAITSVRIYFFILATFSWIFCFFLAKKIFRPQDSVVFSLFLLSISFVYLILPLSEFGQREHFLVLLTLPYLLLVTCRLQDVNISPIPAILIGLMAGIGFALKPFFLLTFFLVELYYLYSQSNFNKMIVAWMRPETLAIIFFLIAYALFIFVFYQAYLTVIVPIATRFYYQLFGEPWGVVIIEPLVFYTGAGFLLYFISYKTNHYNKLTLLLALASIGYLIVYLSQQLSWYYHLIPALSIEFILTALIFSMFIQQIKFHLLDCLLAAILGFILFFIPFQFFIIYYRFGIMQKSDLAPVITYLQQHEKNRPVYFFSTKSAYMVSVIEQAGAIHSSRLQFLAWMQRYFRLDLPQNKSPQQIRDENFFINMLTEDLTRNKPDIIFVDNLSYMTRTNSSMSLDYLAILSKNSAFQTAWKHYHYVKTVEGTKDSYYKFSLYKRS